MSQDETPNGAPESEPEADEGAGGFYVQDLAFRSGVVPDQAPGAMAVAAALGGFDPPRADEGLTYCDLGCGDGTTVNALASVFPEARFVGVDFNPGHIRKARETAAQCGLTNARFVQASFDQLMAQDLPTFDMVAMNGTYAWLEEPLAQAVRAFLTEKLRAGGLFYVEYTSLPGKVSVEPFWRLIQTLVPPEAGSDSRDRARQALGLTEKLAGRGMRYLDAHRPARNGANGYLRSWRDQPYTVDHFAHNALASGFRPRYFTDMYDEMDAAGLRYAGRTALRLNWTDTSVPSAQVPSLLPYKDDARLREMLKDYIRNEQQRRDVFARKGSQGGEPGAFLAGEVGLLARRPAATMARSLTTLGGETITLEGQATEALIRYADEEAVTPVTVATAEGLPVDQVRRAAMRLLATNQFFLCLTPSRSAPAEPAKQQAIRLPNSFNRLRLQEASDRLQQTMLMSPVTRGPAIPISAPEAVLLQAALSTGGFDGAVEKARADLAGRRTPIKVGKNPRPAEEIPAQALQQLLASIRGRKLLNMFRLGIAEPAN